ncbi:MAG: glutathione S-transferase [Proteobacteria bacterium]|nr:glutathione S-transferase [Pseudomonadota bacterium]
MKLYSSTASPYVRKVLVCAHELGLAPRIEPIPTGRDNRPALLGASNPLGKIPTLITDDGVALFDSPVICEYLDGLAGGGRLFPAAGPARIAALKSHALGQGMIDAAWLTVNERRRPDPYRWPDWIEKQQGKILRSLDFLEGETAALEGAVTIGTVAIAVAIAYAEFRKVIETDWRQSHPKLARWFDGFSRRPAMKATAFRDEP